MEGATARCSNNASLEVVTDYVSYSIAVGRNKAKSIDVFLGVAEFFGMHDIGIAPGEFLTEVDVSGCESLLEAGCAGDCSALISCLAPALETGLDLGMDGVAETPTSCEILLILQYPICALRL